MPRHAIIFEDRITKLFVRFTDVFIPGVKIEFKSVQELTPKIARQLARDIVTNLGHDLERLKGLRIVFERDAPRISETTLRQGIRDALKKTALLGEAALRNGGTTGPLDFRTMTAYGRIGSSIWSGTEPKFTNASWNSGVEPGIRSIPLLGMPSNIGVVAISNPAKNCASSDFMA